MRGVGSRLRRRAAELGLSDAEVARRVGITPRRYGNYVTDAREPDFATLVGICQALQMTPGEALGTRAPPTTDTATETAAAGAAEFAQVPVFDIKAAAGDGRLVDQENELYRVAFRHQWLRQVTAAPIDMLCVIEVDGDSMWPTLSHGDHVLVDMTQTMPRREGLYVFRRDDELQVKRVSPHPETGRLSLISDNPAYPTYDNIDPAKVNVLGRVIWAGRRL